MNEFVEWAGAHPVLHALLMLVCGTVGGASVGIVAYTLVVYVLEAL